MSHFETRLLSHAQKVKQLYKAVIRDLQSHFPKRHLFRYHAVVMRGRFDEHKDERDMIKAKQLLADAQEEYFYKKHPQQIAFPYAPGGAAHGREIQMPDWVLDYWHPLEKAQYPEYFALREKRKQEYIERWEKKYGKAQEETH